MNLNQLRNGREQALHKEKLSIDTLYDLGQPFFEDLMTF